MPPAPPVAEALPTVTFVRLTVAPVFTNTAAPAPSPPPPPPPLILLAVPPAPPCATALLIVRLAIDAVPACTKKARPALLASSVLPLPVTVTLAVIIGSDCAERDGADAAVDVMVLLPPAALESKMAWRSEPAPLSLTLLTMKSAAQAEHGDRQVPAKSNAVSRRGIRPGQMFPMLPMHPRPSIVLAAIFLSKLSVGERNGPINRLLGTRAIDAVLRLDGDVPNEAAARGRHSNLRRLLA